jgi:inorganic phosphate transporter, PiT family
LEIFDGSVGWGTLLLLGVCLLIALGFEFVNGFHDTANAVATVIYTNSLKPNVAVVWSGLMNFFGVLFSSGAVAFGIVHLLPVDLLININGTAGILMVLSLLTAAILWNVLTWYYGLPSSSSHALIGSILGVGLASSFFSGQGFGSGVNWGKAQETGLALLVSPMIGFGCAALLLLLAKALIRDPRLYEEPKPDTPPPLWIRAVLCVTCTGVSFAHGSNDGQKGIGLIMLIVIGLLPTQFSINPALTPEARAGAVASLRGAERIVRNTPEGAAVADGLADVAGRLERITTVKAMSDAEKKDLRAAILRTDDALGKLVKSPTSGLSGADLETVKTGRKALTVGVTDFILPWVPLAVALALGIGTTIGWKRIVVTVGEKIGKSHLTYAQGAAAELVAMCTIFGADHLGLPVSTTHVLSSGVAGTMAANRSGLQGGTVRNIALAWILTLPVTILLSGTLFALTAGAILRKDPPPVVQPRQERTRVPLQGNVLTQPARPVALSAGRSRGEVSGW